MLATQTTNDEVRVRQQATAMLLCAILTVAGLADSAPAATRHVANNGQDAGSCTASSPCRSIGFAIVAATAGDKVVVGPGVYGDLNDDNDYADPGEETPFGGYLIEIDKAVKVISRDGAHATVLRVTSGVSAVGEGVVVTAAGAQFGDKGKGFTIITGSTPPASAEAIQIFAGDVKIAGNVVTGDWGDGISVDGPGPVLVADNRVLGPAATSGLRRGIVALAANVSFLRNFASGWSLGFIVDGNGALLKGNVAVRNGGVGLSLSGSSARVTKNAFLSNRGGGVTLFSVPTVLSGNSFFDNGGFPGNCGVSSSSLSVTATGNYWGASTGPGPDPADDTCTITGAVTAAPFSSTEFRVRLKPLK